MSEYAWLPSLDFSQDTDVVQERPQRQPIRSPGELTAAEKAALLDLLQAGADMLPGVPKPVTREHFDRLMELVFSDKWNSRIGGAKHPKLPSRQFEHCTLPVGNLNEDLPLPETATVGGEAEKAPPTRRYGAGVYFRLKVIGKRLAWSFTDVEGKRVQERYVDRAPGLPTTMEDLKADLIQHYDRQETKRVCEYNARCIVNLARRRIARFSKAGTENPPCVEVKDLPTKLVRVKLAGDLVTAMADSYESEEDEIKKEGSESEEDEIKKEGSESEEDEIKKEGSESEEDEIKKEDSESE